MNIQPNYSTLGKFNPPVQPTPIIEVHRRAIDAKQEEVRAAYERISKLEADLNECREFLEDQIDVVDGSYGEPAPNRAMVLVCMIDETLDGGLS